MLPRSRTLAPRRLWRLSGISIPLKISTHFSPRPIPWKRPKPCLRIGLWACGFASAANAPPAAFVVAGPCKLPVPALEPTAGEIRLLYVRGAFQNQRLGAQLLEIALEWLSEQRRTPLYVGVWSENFGAQRFYARYGFEKVGEYYFPVGNTRDLEFILKR